ncbi:MAG: protein kinase, partial [Cyanobacteria bacterium J06631_9]
MTSSTSQFPQIDGYTLTEHLYSSSQTRVYRAVQSTQQQKVVIKVLAEGAPSQRGLAQLRDQYAIAKSLSTPGIVRPLRLEPYSGGHALIMEDWGGVPLDRYTQPLDLTELLGIAIQLTDILHDLHQHRVIHKDIKPA